MAGVAEREQTAAGLASDDAPRLLAEQMLRLARERREAITLARTLRQKQEFSTRNAIVRIGERDDAQERLDEARAERRDREQELAEAREQLADELERWLEQLRELELRDELRVQLLAAAEAAGADEQTPLAELIGDGHRAAVARIETDRAAAANELKEIRLTEVPLRDELDALAAEQDPEPQASPVRERTPGRAGPATAGGARSSPRTRRRC
jgi:hypothetical protein